mmetsp:Transcript_91873/g.182516  ORF Transcript_91873/g.182516 Transcript_91873/m.182516 type:complete len:297 (+) Transcript_91873:795-1685(+)
MPCDELLGHVPPVALEEADDYRREARDGAALRRELLPSSARYLHELALCLLEQVEAPKDASVREEVRGPQDLISGLGSLHEWRAEATSCAAATSPDVPQPTRSHIGRPHKAEQKLRNHREQYAQHEGTNPCGESKDPTDESNWAPAAGLQKPRDRVVDPHGGKTDKHERCLEHSEHNCQDAERAEARGTNGKTSKELSKSNVLDSTRVAALLFDERRERGAAHAEDADGRNDWPHNTDGKGDELHHNPEDREHQSEDNRVHRYTHRDDQDRAESLPRRACRGDGPDSHQSHCEQER